VDEQGTVGWLDIHPPGRLRRLELREIWERRELIGLLTARDISLRYKQAFFGVAWAILEPLISALLFVAVFRNLLNVQTGRLPYWLFAAIGLAAWYYFSGAVDNARGSLVSESSLITKVYFPRLIVPIAAVLPGLVDLMISLVFVLIAAVVTDLGIGWHVLLIPLLMAWLVVVAFGLGTLVATLNVRFRDARNLTSLVTELLFFASPIAYPSNVIPSGYRWLYFLNPVATIVELMRWCLAGDGGPGVPGLMAIPGTMAVLGLGLLVYRLAEPGFADVI
jgi:lipopolysaccharide transport system permease protein